jgi:hypothetical protein
MGNFIFWTLLAATIVLPFWFVLTIWNERNRGVAGRNWINKDSREMYVKVLETAAAAAAIAASIIAAIVSNGEPRAYAVLVSVRWSVVCLVACITFALATMLALSRAYDRARSRFVETELAKVATTLEQGQLRDVELRWILILGYFCLASFFAGFLFVGRIAFQM